MLETNKIHQGDCLEVLKTIPDNSIDAVVTDPPYGLSFMGKKWDYEVPSIEIWKECLRVLKPGGYLLSFAGTRTQHRMAVNIEDAGFEIRDMIAWVYGSGFPKSLNVGKAIDKLQGNEREETGEERFRNVKPYDDENGWNSNNTTGGHKYTKGQSEWEGWGTALKPSWECITVARKPLSEKNVAENVLKWGTGGINIDGCRVEGNEDQRRPSRGGDNGLNGTQTFKIRERKIEDQVQQSGRFPANLIHDGSDEVVGLFPQTNGAVRQPTGKTILNPDTGWNNNSMTDTTVRGFADSGSAARFFYCAKASKSERNAGCEGLENKKPCYESHRANYENTKGIETPYAGTGRGGNNLKNNHPTVKPIALMEYLIKLVSREDAVILDPFAGSGTTGIACVKLNRDYILIEREAEYVEIAKNRIEAEEAQGNLFREERKPIGIYNEQIEITEVEK